MPQHNITIYKVFIASPGDVKEERLIVKKVIEEINLVGYLRDSIRLELIAWETHTYPSIGIDAQDVINNQIDDYDIFIGIMWNRFGTATGRAESGTKEEFDRAFQKHKNDSGSVKVLFYFKTTPPLSLNDIDIDGLQKVRDFQNQLRLQGVLYREFSQEFEFEKLLRFSLVTAIKDFEKKNDSQTLPKAEEEYLEAKVVQEEEVTGYFEALDMAAKYSRELETILIKMTFHINTLGNHVTKKTDRINNLSNVNQINKAKEAKKIIDQLANNMDNYSAKTREELPKLNKTLNSLVKCYYTVLTIYGQISDNEEENNSLLNLIIGVQESVESARNSLNSMKQAVSNTPSMTTKYAKSKKETVQVLNDVATEFSTYINLIDEIKRSISVAL